MPGRRSKKPAWGKIAAIALGIAGLAAAWRYTPLSEWITADRIFAWARTFRAAPWAEAALVFSYTPAAIVMFPRPLLTLFGVVAFGPWLGFAYSMAGILTSALAMYYMGRALPQDIVQRIAGERLEQLSRRLRDHGLVAMTAIRLVPAAPFGLENIIAGAVRIKVWSYTLGTALGMAPGVLATAVFGTQITAAFEDLSTVNYWLIAATIAILGLVTWGVTRWVARKD